MKRIFTLIAIAAAALGSMAQEPKLRPEQSSTLIKYEIIKCLESMPASKIVGTSSEQGHDQLDSLYFLNMKIYDFPYDNHRDKDYVNKLVTRFVNAYDADLKHHTGGYCYTSQLREDNPVESKLLSMYYGEGLEPLVVGGKGHNYVVLRFNYQQNPSYRHIKGVEWWLETDSKKSSTVRMRTFMLSGPQSADHYQVAKNNSDNKSMVTLTSKEDLLKGITLLGKLYTENKDANIDRSVVKGINERIIDYLKRTPLYTDDYMKLFQTLRDIPDYWVSVTFDDPSHTTLAGNFTWLVKNFSGMHLSSVTWDDNPNLTHAANKEKTVTMNFELKIFVTDNNPLDFTK